MNDSTFAFADLIERFLLMGTLYAIPVGIIFLIAKKISAANPSPYTGQAFLALCLPGIFYGLLEGFSDRQGLNFMLVVPMLIVAAVLATFVLQKINVNVFALLGCAAGLVLWLVVPNASLRLA